METYFGIILGFFICFGFLIVLATKYDTLSTDAKNNRFWAVVLTISCFVIFYLLREMMMHGIFYGEKEVLYDVVSPYDKKVATAFSALIVLIIAFISFGIRFSRTEKTA